MNNEKDTVSGSEDQRKVYTLKLAFDADDETEVEREYRFHKPREASYERYIKTMSSSATKSSKAFALDNVHPDDKAALERDIKEYPAMALSISEKLLGMLGLTKTTNLMQS